jgi:hypothetical protein
MKNLKITFLLLSIFLCWGCTSRPTDVPDVFPCKITVKNGTTPIVGAFVTLGLEQGSNTYSSSGVTDNSGVAEIKTVRLNWKGTGVPAGKYIVIIAKEPDTSSITTKDRESVSSMSMDERERYSLEMEKKIAALPREIPSKLSQFTTSPLRITVENGKENTLDVDVAQIPKK